MQFKAKKKPKNQHVRKENTKKSENNIIILVEICF